MLTEHVIFTFSNPDVIIICKTGVFKGTDIEIYVNLGFSVTADKLGQQRH